jgi:hypothetical protein
MRLAELLTSLERHHEATEFYERRFRANMEVGGPDDTFTFESFGALGNSYDAEKRFEDAERLCEKYMDALKAVGDDAISFIARTGEWLIDRGERRFRSELDASGADSESACDAYCHLMESYDAERRFEAMVEIHEEYVDALMELDDGKGDTYLTRVQKWTTELREKRFQTELEDSGPDAESTYDAFEYLVCEYDAQGRKEDGENISETYIDILRALDGKGGEYVEQIRAFMASDCQSEQSEDEQLESEGISGKGKEVQTIS